MSDCSKSRNNITVLYKVFNKRRVLFGFMVCSMKVLLQFYHRIEAHIDVVVKSIEINSSVYFYLSIEDNFVEIWGGCLIFQSQHPTKFLIFSIF